MALAGFHGGDSFVPRGRLSRPATAEVAEMNEEQTARIWAHVRRLRDFEDSFCGAGWEERKSRELLRRREL
jgi:hypothetical protein